MVYIGIEIDEEVGNLPSKKNNHWFVMHVLHKKYSALENLKKIHKCVCLMLH
jgi:hypothetical protein